MKKIIIPAVALLLAVGSSAFTTKFTTSNFYKYNGPAARSQSDIQDINNYTALAANPCEDVTNVCGVTLSTARNVGQTPVASEFNAQKTPLWSSQQAHSPANDAIAMEE